MSEPEFSRPLRLDSIGSAAREMHVEADEAERLALARRFDLIAIDSLKADLSVREEAVGIRATGRLEAAVVQSCIASSEPVPATVAEAFDILFRPEPTDGAGEEEVELDEGEMDVVFYDGGSVDVGEAVAQTLALALDPYPRAPDADAKLDEALGEQPPTGPFAALAALKGKQP